MSISDRIPVISLFTGCGGLDLGIEGEFAVKQECLNYMIHSDWKDDCLRPGWDIIKPTVFKTVFANDILRPAMAAWVPYFTKRNNRKEDYRLRSIVDLVKDYKSGVPNVFPSADVVTGGFPCQDFSVAGKRLGFQSHKSHNGYYLTDNDNPTEENRGKLYMWMREVIEIVKPKVFIAENVKGMVSLQNVKQTIERDFRNIGSGYLVADARVLYAPDYGVPQTRERVVFIGFRRDALRSKALAELERKEIAADYDPYPVKTHGQNGQNSRKYVAVKYVLKDLKEPDKSDDLSQRSYSKAKYYGSHCQGQSEINLNAPGPTIRAEHHGNIEFRRLSFVNGGSNFLELNKGYIERRLTVRECARIQTFPDDYEFVRTGAILGDEYRLSVSEGYKVIGNAVPPLLGYHIARRLQKIWDKLF